MIIIKPFENSHKTIEAEVSLLLTLESEHISFIISKIEKDNPLSSRKSSNLIKGNFNLNVSKNNSFKCLKKNGYSFKSPKLRMKNDEEQQKIMINWCERHLFRTNFNEVFFSDETTFYLDSPKGWLWLLKNKDNIIDSKNRGRK